MPMEQFEKSFLDKLGALNGTQASIQTLSAWLIQNKGTVKHVGKLWYKELKKVHRKRKLTLLYLMNDVVQNSRKQGPEFLRVFSSVLTHALKDCAKAADPKVLASLDRLVRIWQDRRVFEPELLQRSRQMLQKFAAARGGGGGRPSVGRPTASASAATGTADDDEDDDASAVDEIEEEEGSESGQEGAAAAAAAAAANPALRDAGVGSDDDDHDNVGFGGNGGVESPNVDILRRARAAAVGVGAFPLRAELAAQMALDRGGATAPAAEEPPPDPDGILAELQFLAAAPSGSAEMRRRISRFPKHIVEEAAVDRCRGRRDCQRLLREVAQADGVCSAYNRQLAGEVDRRRAFHADLRAFCRAQRTGLATGRCQLEELRLRLRDLRALRQQLAGHLANLPDLAALPAVAGGGLAPLPSVGDLFS